MPSVFVYSDNPPERLAGEEVAGFLRTLGLRAEFRGDFLRFLSQGREKAAEFESLLSGARVSDIESPVELLREYVPPPGPAGTSVPELYDGFWAQRIFARFFLRRFPGALSEGGFHVVLTGRLLGTFGRRRYHARAVLSGFPSFVSSAGIAEGPAKPGEYYFLRAELAKSGGDLGELDELYRGKFVERDDERITAIARSYVLQPLLHNLAGKEFCDDGGCALFNSHWQREVLDVQYEGKLCAGCAGEIAAIARER